MNAPRRQLTLVDSTSIIVGIIIGAGIYGSANRIAMFAGSSAAVMGLWICGGLISLAGAMCYAELATMFPEEGGDYVYLTRGWGRPPGFLFVWTQLWIVRPGSLGSIAYIFAISANQLLPLPGVRYPSMVYATSSIVILTLVNLIGVREGKWTQNLLTLLKVLGLGAIVLVAFLHPVTAVAESATNPISANWPLAMVFVLFTYGGWNEIAYVAAEVRHPERNLLRALVIGTLAVTAIYVLVNFAFLHVLGLTGMSNSSAVASDVLERPYPAWGGRAISLLICLSALGSINGQIFTGARIYYALGTEHALFRWLGRWSSRWDTPAVSLLVQGVVTVALTIAFGFSENSFERFVIFTTPVFWAFSLLVVAALVRLRFTEPGRPRPYRVQLLPVTVLIFGLASAFMLYSSVSYAIDNRSQEVYWSLVLLAVGVFFSFLDAAPSSATRRG